jgi:hypothetical protein
VFGILGLDNQIPLEEKGYHVYIHKVGHLFQKDLQLSSFFNMKIRQGSDEWLTTPNTIFLFMY